MPMVFKKVFKTVCGPSQEAASGQGPSRLDQGGHEKRPRTSMPDKWKEGKDSV